MPVNPFLFQVQHRIKCKFHLSMDCLLKTILFPQDITLKDLGKWPRYHWIARVVITTLVSIRYQPRTWRLLTQPASSQELSRCMAGFLPPLMLWGPLRDLSKVPRPPHRSCIRVPPSRSPLLWIITTAPPCTLPVLLLLLRDFPLLVVTTLCQLFLMLRILIFHIPLYLLAIHTGNKCLPHRMRQRSGQLEIIHFLVKIQLSAIRHRFHLHHHNSTTSSRVFQDTILSRGQLRAFHQPKTIWFETTPPWLQPATQQILVGWMKTPLKHGWKSVHFQSFFIAWRLKMILPIRKISNLLTFAIYLLLFTVKFCSISLNPSPSFVHS